MPQKKRRAESAPDIQQVSADKRPKAPANSDSKENSIGLTATAFATPTLMSSSYTPAVIALWSGDDPTNAIVEENGTKGLSVVHVSRPVLRVYQSPNIAAGAGPVVLAIGGGGFDKIETGNESTPAALWLTDQPGSQYGKAGLGIATVYELIYRLTDGPGTTDQLADAQRALRLVRSLAGANQRVGVMAFSAGGYLAGMTSFAPTKRWYTGSDNKAQLPVVPDFLALLYPILTVESIYKPNSQAGQHVLPQPAPNQEHAPLLTQIDLSVPTHVTAAKLAALPTFIAQAINDNFSPVANSLLLISAAQGAPISGAELAVGNPHAAVKTNANPPGFSYHIYPSGGHGFGLGSLTQSSPINAWRGRFAEWYRACAVAPTTGATASASSSAAAK